MTIKNEYNPDTVTPPHETILETMEARNIGLMDMVLMMLPTMEPEQTEALLRGEVEITEDIAMQLESVFGTPTHFWMKRQQRYNEVNLK